MRLAITKNSIYLSLAILIIAALLFFGDSEKNPLTPEKPPTKLLYPYAVARNASTSHFAKNGLLDYTFQAKTIEYFREDKESKALLEYTLVKQPRVVIYMETQPWFITANEGMYTEQENKLVLWDNVIVTQPGETGQKTELTTEQLAIYPVEKLAETHEAVKITSPLGQVEAIGMKADLAAKKIKLLSQVRGTHDPI